MSDFNSFRLEVLFLDIKAVVIGVLVLIVHKVSYSIGLGSVNRIALKLVSKSQMSHPQLLEDYESSSLVL